MGRSSERGWVCTARKLLISRITRSGNSLMMSWVAPSSLVRVALAIHLSISCALVKGMSRSSVPWMISAGALTLRSSKKPAYVATASS